MLVRIVRLMFEIVCAPITIPMQYMFIRNEAKSFETNPWKLNLYPLALAPVAFLIRLKNVFLGNITL